jgi:phage/plasmid-associated DNA primase
MIRGGDFYAVWIEERGQWSTDEDDLIQLIDRELDRYAEDHKVKFEDGTVKILHMWDSSSGVIDSWHKYCQKQMRDSYTMLDEKLIFSNTDTEKKDYSSKKLTYPLETCDISAYDKLISTLYTEEERHKLEWAIGSIVSGDSKHIQKFMVLYGAAGTGKSTILNIIQQLFDGYYSVFDAKALGSASSQFALESFKTNPLVAIQHDGDLSKIEDNTRLNSLVSHELMTVNEKFKGQYENRFKCFLFMGTNKPVKITDAKSGLLRRLIDVSPSGNKLDPREYKRVMKQVSFELGGIAQHCLEVYQKNPGAYDDYIPTAMMGASNDFYNFVVDSYSIFKNEDGTTMKAAWEMYKVYCDEAKVPYPFSQRVFKEELKNYFWDFKERFIADDGTRLRSYYTGFRTDKFDGDERSNDDRDTDASRDVRIDFSHTTSIFDRERAECIAQYASDKGVPSKKWDNVKTKLSSLDTSKLHYVKVPENHIVIDFDIKDKEGNKSFDRNVEEASKWPATYAELSKSGNGVHLHYIYTGDVTKLSHVYDDHIEVKVFTGGSSLRRKLTKCNDLPIATISSGLPLKGDKKLVDFEGIKSEKAIRTLIKRNLEKEYHPGTKPSIDFIHKILEDAYNSGVGYDVSDMRNAVYAFAANSTNQSDYCIKLVGKMKFKSEEATAAVANDEAPLVFYDVEVFPNLFLVNWKIRGKDRPVNRMINPKPSEIEDLIKMRLVGFNNRSYDNHMLYARLLGYSNEQLYDLSTRLVSKDKMIQRKAKFGEAFNISYTDVHDFAATKQSLKKWEIELGIKHKELGLPWDKPVPEHMWIQVAEYCDNDVIATEALFDHLSADFTARQILADVAGMTVNDTTNSLTTRIIFGNNRKPQDQFNYRDMGDMSVPHSTFTMTGEGVMFNEFGDEYTVFDDKGRPLFPGYKYEFGKSTYRGEEVGEGGYVYAEPGIYGNVALLDIASMHPASIIAEQLFGPEYTKRFQEIRDARIAIKHKDFDAARKMLNGALAKYLDDPQMAKDLAQALKIAINSVYGLTAAKFENAMRDPRNKDNIVAKRGALFMINLKHEVQKRGFIVVHVKTDSIKIADATPEIIKFVMDYGQQYGYTFEHEDTYDRICLMNDAVYIAKYKEPHIDKTTGAEVWWTATGAQFQVPYVFKKLFSKEPIVFDDMCETKEVKTALYLDKNEDLPAGEHNYIFIGKVGRFCPIKPGCGGAELVRESTDKDGNIKYDSATGAKDYRWLESEMVKELGKEDDINRSYYDNLVDSAIYGNGSGASRKPGISDFGDFEWFVSDDPYIGPEYDGHGRPVYYPTEEDDGRCPFDVR